jgi:hypothetical protein
MTVLTCSGSTTTQTRNRGDPQHTTDRPLTVWDRGGPAVRHRRTIPVAPGTGPRPALSLDVSRARGRGIGDHEQGVGHRGEGCWVRQRLPGIVDRSDRPRCWSASRPCPTSGSACTLCVLVGRRARPGTGVDLGPFDPAAQGLGMHVDQRPDLAAGLDRRLTWMRLSTLLEHPHRPVACLLVVLAGCRHESILHGRSEPPPVPGHLIGDSDHRPGVAHHPRMVGQR